MIQVGEKAPDFELDSDDGGRVSLSECLRDGPVVVYFYPADFTPVCTAQACMVRDAHERLLASGVRVLAISPQSADSHKRFKDKHGLDFTLLTDPDRTAIRAYGVSALFGLLTRRATFLVGQDGLIKDRAGGDLSVSRHRALIERSLS